MPTSSLERDARRIHGMHAGEVKLTDMAIGVIIGRTSESFDFLVYAIASVVGFPRLVFPYVNALVDRAYGRGPKFGVALMLLGTSTVVIGAVSCRPGFGARWIVGRSGLTAGGECAS